MGALHCSSCQRAVLLPEVIRAAAAHVRVHGIEWWHAHQPQQPPHEQDPLLRGIPAPECCAGARWQRSADTLDVWFESGLVHQLSGAPPTSNVRNCNEYLESNTL